MADDDVSHCEECGYCFPITKTEAMSICSAMPSVGAWTKYRANVIQSVGFALKLHGICALRTELVDKLSIACNEFYSRDD